MIFVIGLQLLLFIMGFQNFLLVQTSGTRLEVIGGHASGLGIALKADIITSTLLYLLYQYG